MKVFTVSEINRIIKNIIDNEVILEDIVVAGELSSFSVTRNVAYFTLKDSTNLLSCVQFGVNKTFNIGDLVQCRGNVTYYPKGGKLSFQALSIELAGQGELYKQFLELKDKLEKEGLFDESHKIPIPRFVNSIGVVTSSTGAVLQDIKNVTSRRNPNLDIYVYDAQVQGKFATKQIIEGISYFDNMSDVDVIIVARGGGSIEDLMPFNDEELARIAYICNKPIISAVGHETDYSILDFVSDLRAPTPSAAAELVTYNRSDVKRYLLDLQAAMENNVKERYSVLESSLNLAIGDIDRSINSMLNEQSLQITDLINSCQNSIDRLLEKTIYRVNISLSTLDKLNPIKLLRSGYSLVTKDKNSIKYSNVAIDDMLNITANDVKLTARVLSKEKR